MEGEGSVNDTKSLIMGLDEDFKAAADSATSDLPESMSNDDKLAMYGLYKQATVGDVNSACPNIFDQKGRAKWFAWEKCKGQSQDDAKTAYIALIASLKAKYGV
ncbi:hypothetical protein CEUSTIGMA_g10645.t1 [Chlamydomonas eustigma]|uniref:ACB domain-containing protein n=1 Tax=Chlamydomonas eustigma TaxID=1157962 RepID=A0A250XJX0_9CHLO|nr:hypothetical protein CEUSTIGMA_g10645.t1 [Chlamydomonas eustigma]|eukprot:GAX83219.1 hypothetical protein CEUSTIGMA_g10645.t1 [Chlamydomonas eustigma]